MLCFSYVKHIQNLEVKLLKAYYNNQNAFGRSFLIPSLFGRALDEQAPLEIFKLLSAHSFRSFFRIYNVFAPKPLMDFAAHLSMPCGRAWQLLQENNLLEGEHAQANFEAVARHQEPEYLTKALEILDKAGLLSGEHGQARFNQIMQHANLLFSEPVKELWGNLASHHLTEARWNHITQLCRANQVNLRIGQARLVNYINQDILGINERAAANAFNQRQSTHTASVHQSVSESAIRLNKLYGDKINDLQETLEAIEAWVNAQDEHEVEKRAIQQLVYSFYEFIDQTSGINTKTLLALSWMAIHDEETRTGTLDDAKELLLQGLFEIQRAYNLSDTFEDDKDEHDKASCASGTFNKFIEKLVGVHPAAELKYITKKGADLKLTPLILESAIVYLKQADLDSRDLNLESLKKAVLSTGREQLLFEYAGGPIEALAKNYDTFEAFQASDNYPVFQGLIIDRQDEGLEQMIEGKLVVDGTDVGLDEKLNALIIQAKPIEEKAAEEEEEPDVPLTKEEMKKARLKMFDKSDADVSESNSSEESKDSPSPGTGK
ncbi:MAG: hypothetical protein QNK11_01640 [Legionella sp.]|nr:hypothetical protein [Legionella sp.]